MAIFSNVRKNALKSVASPGLGGVKSAVSNTRSALKAASSPVKPPTAAAPYKPFTADFGANITGSAPRISQYLAANQERIPGVIQDITRENQNSTKGAFSDAEARLDRGILGTARAEDFADVQSPLTGFQQSAISDKAFQAMSQADKDTWGESEKQQYNKFVQMRAQEARRNALNERIKAVRDAVIGQDSGALDTIVRGAYQTGAKGNREALISGIEADRAKIKGIQEEASKEKAAIKQRNAVIDAQAAADEQVRTQQTDAINSQIKALENELALAKKGRRPDGSPVSFTSGSAFEVIGLEKRQKEITKQLEELRKQLGR